MDARMELSKPVHSRATRMEVPAAFLIMPETSSSPIPRSIRTVRTEGTSFLANSRRDSTKSVITIGEHPAAWHARSVTRPIGPAPLFLSVAVRFMQAAGGLTR